MTFVQLQFLIFLFFTFLAFYICPVKFRWIVLLISSLVFYGIASIKFLPFIIFTSLTIYLCGLKMGKIYSNLDKALEADGLDKVAKKQLKEDAKKHAKKFVALAISLNIGLLCIIKFTRFVEIPINHLIQALGGEGTFSAAFIIVPLGISYYTFSCVSYLLDVYWKRVDYEKNYARFLLYAIYFPHILQGPIERYGRLGQRLKGEFRFDYDRFCKGCQLMLWGFFKKLVIADRINIFVDGVYAPGSQAEGVVYIIAFFLDVVYIYADFSGCMDIARGASQIFGVELDLNFDHPFSSKSVVEFWRRWHMSLGSWFKDYVYYPISTSKLVKNITKFCKNKELSEGLTRGMVTIIPVFVTWVSTGIWHGTGKTYLCWGLYYAFMIFMSVTFGDTMGKLADKMHMKRDTDMFHLFQMFRTTCIFAGGRLLTRPGTLALSAHALKSALTTYNPWVLIDESLYNYGLDEKNFQLMLIVIIIFGVISAFQMKQPIREWIAKQNIVFRWIIYIVAFYSVVIFGIYGVGYDPAAFVYMAY